MCLQDEEIRFGDDSSQQSLRGKKQLFSENNENSPSSTTNRTRNRPVLFKNSRRGLWSNMTSQSTPKSEKQATRTKKRRGKKKPSGRSKTKPRYEDPLKQLSLTHEKMAQSQGPFSPSKAFGILRNRRQIGNENKNEYASYPQDIVLDEPLVELPSQPNVSFLDENGINDENCPAVTVTAPKSQSVSPKKVGPRPLDEVTSGSLSCISTVSHSNGPPRSIASPSIPPKEESLGIVKTAGTKDISKFKFSNILFRCKNFI
jgi:hypothetical protein